MSLYWLERRQIIKCALFSEQFTITKSQGSNMASAKEQFKTKNNVETKVKEARKGLNISTPATTGDLATVQPKEVEAVPTTVVDDSQRLDTDSAAIATTSAINQNLSPMYEGANTALEGATNGAILSFETVLGNLQTILSADITVEQLRSTIGGMTVEDRIANLAVLDEIENHQVVEKRKQEIQDNQIDIELKRIQLQLKYVSGMMKNALKVEEIKDLENQLDTAKKENELKQQSRNDDLNSLAGSNAIKRSRIANRLSFEASCDQKLKEAEDANIEHKGAMNEITKALYQCTQRGYMAYKTMREVKVGERVSLAERMRAASESGKGTNKESANAQN